MHKFSIDTILKKINNEECFWAVAEDYSFTLKITNYTHFACFAIHNGHQFRKDLWDNCLHSEYDRWFEEDPETATFIANQPIVMAGCDSRFEYDLNRAPEAAVFKEAWGKQLWKKPLLEDAINKSLEKHNNFYRVVKALIDKIEELHGAALVYDVHSYNYKRWNRFVPTFNLGTSLVDNKKFQSAITLWQELLSTSVLPQNINTDCLINDVFKGEGYLLKFITQHFKNTLVLATEIKKIYCNELEEVLFPEIIQALKENINTAIIKHSSKFAADFAKR